jgi:hypothetical protein
MSKFLNQEGLKTLWELIKDRDTLRGSFEDSFIPLAGQICFDEGGNQFKVGDGATAWKDLDYFEGNFKITDNGNLVKADDGSILISGFTDAEPGQILQKGEDNNLKWVDTLVLYGGSATDLV